MASDGNDKFTLFVDKKIGELVNRLSPAQSKILLATITAFMFGTFMTLLFIYPFAMNFHEHGFNTFNSWMLATLLVTGIMTLAIALTQREEIVKWMNEKCFSAIDEG
jgi:predicted benzoate:H+ symporter BenE